VLDRTGRLQSSFQKSAAPQNENQDADSPDRTEKSKNKGQ
jgi:hypothetical protein